MKTVWRLLSVGYACIIILGTYCVLHTILCALHSYSFEICSEKQRIVLHVKSCYYLYDFSLGNLEETL